MRVLVSTAWLDDHLRDPNLVVLHTSQGVAAREQIPSERAAALQLYAGRSASHDSTTETLRR